MDFEIQLTLICVSVALLVIGLGLFYYNYSNIIRLNKLLVHANTLAMESAEEGYLLADDLTRTYAKWVEPHALAANVAFVAHRYAEASRHAERTCLLLNAISPWVTSYYESLLCSEPDNTQRVYIGRLRNWMHDTAIRASVLEKYENNDYPGALKQVDEFSEDDEGYLKVADAWRAHFCLLLGDFQRAEKHLLLAEKCQPEGGQHISIRGHWYLIHGDEKGAIECYRRHNDADSLNQDFKHIEMVFGIKPPCWQ